MLKIERALDLVDELRSGRASVRHHQGPFRSTIKLLGKSTVHRRGLA